MVTHNTVNYSQSSIYTYLLKLKTLFVIELIRYIAKLRPSFILLKCNFIMRLEMVLSLEESLKQQLSRMSRNSPEYVGNTYTSMRRYSFESV